MIWFVGRLSPDFYDYVEQHTIPYGVFVDAHRPGRIPEHVPTCSVDFTSPQSIIESCRKQTLAVSGVIAMYENFIVPLAVIAKDFGVAGLTAAAAQLCTDKALMRQSFLNFDPSISPDYRKVTTWRDIADFMRQHDYPVVLKPTNLVKSLLVTKNHNAAELQANYDHALQTIHHLYEKHHVKHEPQLIIEEFLEGSVHSVDAFVGSRGEAYILRNIVDYETGYDIGKHENYHFSRLLPSRLNRRDQTAIREVAKKGLQALGLTATPAHIEVILTRDGPKIVEIGARTGGYRPRMHSFANGIDLYQAAIDTCLGNVPNVKSRTNRYCAVLEIFPDKEGQFVRLTHRAIIKKLPSLLYLSIKPKVGSVVGRSSKGHKATTVIMLGNSDQRQFNQDYNFIKDRAKVVVQAE